MAIDPALIQRLRRLTAEPTLATYSDTELTTRIEATLVTRREMRFAGETAETVTIPDSPATYDLYRAAALIWEEKAAALVGQGLYDYSADGQSFNVSQRLEQAKTMVRYCQSRQRVASLRMLTQEVRGARIVINEPEPE